jgi:hypothetical protein
VDKKLISKPEFENIPDGGEAVFPSDFFSF